MTNPRKPPLYLRSLIAVPVYVGFAAVGAVGVFEEAGIVNVAVPPPGAGIVTVVFGPYTSVDAADETEEYSEAINEEAAGPVVMTIVGLVRITTPGDTADDKEDTTLETDDFTLVTRLVAFPTIAEASLEADDLMLVALLVATELTLDTMLVALWIKTEASLLATDFTLSALLEATAPAAQVSVCNFHEE